MTPDERIEVLTGQLEVILRQLEHYQTLMQERDHRLEKILMIVERQSTNIEKLISIVAQATSASISTKYVN